MRRLGRYVSLAILLSLVGLAGTARGDEPWLSNQLASPYRLKHLLTPLVADEPAPLGILNPSGSPCLLASPGSLGVPTCGSPTILFTPDAPLVFGGSGGTHLILTQDGTSIGTSGGALQRLALTYTGAITGTMAAGSGSLTTAFGTAGALSVLSNATNAIAVPAYLQATANSFTFLGETGAGALAFETVPGASIFANGIAIGTVQLASVASGPLAAGTLAWVDSVGDFFRLKQSALTTTPTTVITASGKSGYQWIRVGAQNISWQSQLTWSVDPQSLVNTCSDEATGVSDSVPLCSMGELARRVGGAVYATGTSCIVRLLSNMQTTDAAFFNVRGTGVPGGTAVTPFPVNEFFNVVGVPVVVYSGTAATVHQAAAGAVDENYIIDTSAPAFATTGRLWKRTNGTAAYAWPQKDETGTTSGKFRTSQWVSSFAAATLSNGDSWSILQLPTVNNLTFPYVSNVFQYGLALVDERTSSSSNQQGVNNIRWITSTFAGGSGSVSGYFYNVRDLGSRLVNGGLPLLSISYGGLMSTGLTLPDIGTIVVGGTDIVYVSFQGSGIIIGSGLVQVTQATTMHFDQSTPCISVNYTNASLSYGGGPNYQIGGLGNTGDIWNLQNSGTRIEYVIAPPSGMTSKGSPITLGSTSYAISALPVTDSAGRAVVLATPALTGPGHVRVDGTGFYSVDTGTYLLDPGGNGLVVRTASGTTAARSITSTGASITITNPTGVAGNINLETAGAPPTGAAGGALTGTYPNPGVNVGAGASVTGTLAAAQEPAHTGDVTNTAGSLVLNLVNIPNDTPAAGDILFSTIVTPASPAAGKIRLFNSGIMNAIDHSGNIYAMANNQAAVSSQWLKSFNSSTAGFTTTQPAVSDLQNISASTLLGNPTGSPAAPSGITLGTGLSFAGTVLNAAGTTYTGTSPIVVSGSAISCPTCGTSSAVGTVTNVTATAPVFITGTSTVTPNVTIQGAVTTGGTSTSATSLGALATGAVYSTVSGGVSTISSINPYQVLVDGTDTAPGELAAKVTTSSPLVTTVVSAGAPPATGLQLWLKADTGITQSGGVVSAWADQSGNGYNVASSGSAQPTFVSSAINGKPGLSFNGSTQYMDNTATSILTAGTARTIVVIGKYSGSGSTSGSPFTIRRTTTTSFATLMGVGGTFYIWSDGTHNATITDPAVLNTAETFEWYSTGTSGAGITFSVTGSPKSVTSGGTVSSETGTTGFTVGQREGVGQFFNGTICEVLVYDHVLSGTDDTTLATYAQNKYAIGGASVGETLNFAEQGAIVSGSSTTAPQNLGLLTTGLTKHTISSSIATLSTATAGTDYSAGTSALATGPLCSTTSTGALSACTAGTGLSFSGTTESLATAGAGAATYGGNYQYIQAMTVDAFARVTSVTAATAPMSIYKGWANSISTLGYNTTTILVMTDSGGAPISLTAAPGTSPVTTLAANFASFGGYPVSATNNSGGVFKTNVVSLVASGSGTGVVELSLLYVVTDPSVGTNYAQIADTSFIISPGTTTSYGLGSGIGIIPSGASILLIIWRTDNNNLLTISSGYASASALIVGQ
jgi:hypothetical protein